MSRNDFAKITRFIRFDRKSERSQCLKPINLQWYLQYGTDLLKIHKIVINLAHTLLLYKESQDKPCNKTINKLRYFTTKACQVKCCKGFKTTKICSRCEKYVYGKCTFDNKIICKKCSEVIHLYINKSVILFVYN